MLPLALSSYLAESEVIFGITIALLILSSIAFSLRIFVRTLISRQFGPDDCLVTAAQIFFIATCAISLALWALSTDAGVIRLNQSFGRIPYIPTDTMKLIRAHNVFSSLTRLVAKVSLAVFFCGLYRETTQILQPYLVLGSVAISTLAGMIYLGVTIFSCAITISALPLDHGCDAYAAYTGIIITWSALNSLSNVILCIIAVFALARSRLPVIAKVLASFLILLGTIGTLSSIMNLISQITARSESLQGVVLARWTNLEAGLCVTLASLVAMRPLFQKVADRRSRLSGWDWATKEGGLGFSMTSISSAEPSRSGSLFSRGKRFSRGNIKIMNKSFPLAPGNRSIRSNRSGRTGIDPFVEYVDRRGSHVSHVVSDVKPVRMPATIADPGGLLPGVQDGFGGDEWSKFGEVVVTLQVDVSEEKKRTNSVCFGPDVEGGRGGQLAPPRRPPFVRTRSAR